MGEAIKDAGKKVLLAI